MSKPARNGLAVEKGVAAAEQVVHAAGGVLWRPAPRHPEAREIAAIHRPRYDDWSLPKGKLDPGESATAAAVREIAEETGCRARLECFLSTIRYPLASGKTKSVEYWSARALDGGFAPNDEVDELRWLPVSEARDLMTRALDRAVIDDFAARPPGTSTMVIVRHAKAGKRGAFSGDDHLRPLDTAGRRQASSLVPHLMAFGPTEIYSADRTRCTQTVEPLATRMKMRINTDRTLSEEAYAADPAATRKRVRALAKRDGVALLCSQSGVIPDLLEWWADRDSVRLPTAKNLKGSTWVLTVRKGRLVAGDHYDCPS